MTAVASPPSFSNINRPAWGINGGQSLNSMNPDEVRGMFMPRKTIPRTNSSSSVSSTSSTSSTATAVSTNGQTNGASMPPSGDLSGWPSATPRKRPQGKGQWPPARGDGGTEMGRMPAPRPQMANGVNGVSTIHSPSPVLQSQPQMAPQRPLAEPLGPGQPVLYLLSLNGTFERKTISVPFFPDTLRIGRQTNAKTVPTPVNGFFDSKVLSRQHAEIWADRQGKIWIRDIKSSNGTFVNGTRLSQENRESEPHELQTQDHLELGIDIVNEDQTSVVHRKVAAKVEHAGFLSPSSNLLDMNFGDLDPANAGMVMPQVGGMQFRGRTGSQASMSSNGRMAPTSNMMNAQPNGMHGQRGFWLAPITTEMIVKKLHQEMRSARLQSHDLGRTGQFINALLSKEDVKNLEKPPVPEPPKAAPLVNGNGMPFRADAKARFSDPPAPPPQQPLPEKPDVPSLKRGNTERPKSVPSNTSPIRQDNLSQIIQLTEALSNAKKEIDNQTAKMRDLEEMLQKEREAREAAEELAKRLEDDAHSRMNGSAKAKGDDSILEEAFEPPPNETLPPRESDDHPTSSDQPQTTKADDVKFTDSLLPQIELMMSEITSLKQQMEAYRQRAETAEAERDADRKSLAEMVIQIRQRDEEAKKAATETKTRSLSNRRRPSSGGNVDVAERSANGSSTVTPNQSDGTSEDPTEEPTLSRANTITPLTGASGKLAQDQALTQSLPYASMIGVVLLGMGLMAYINGWQPQPRLDR